MKELEEIVVTDPLDSEVFEDALEEAEQLTPEESSKPVTASTEQIIEISKSIGNDWQKLGTKLGEFLSSATHPFTSKS